MKGRQILVDHINGQEAAALMVDGQLEDFLLDSDSTAPRPGAIYRAIADRPLKGLHGVMLKLGNGQSGFLKETRGIKPGEALTVQVASFAEGRKAPPVSTRLLFKSRFVIVTPEAPGINVARSIRDEEERVRLLDLAHEAFEGTAHGLILRSACNGQPAEDILDDIEKMLVICNDIIADTSPEPQLLLDPPSAGTKAWSEWTTPPPDDFIETDGCFESYDIWQHIEALASPRVILEGAAYMYVEPTRALVAVDINTGADFSPAAALKANISAARALPRALRLRGLGGQITVDFAPLAKKDRRQIEQIIKAAFKKDSIETMVSGWTPLGHLELQRKRSRLPLVLP
ncbi:MAG: ribonuclease E/G [Rhodobacteraceae bacterium]|nr:ribonuclease E/G [Paracoccaceae bacterium]